MLSSTSLPSSNSLRGDGAALLAVEPYLEIQPPLVMCPSMARVQKECGPPLTVRPRDGNRIVAYAHWMPGAVVAALLPVMSRTRGMETLQPPTMTPCCRTSVVLVRLVSRTVVVFPALAQIAVVPFFRLRSFFPPRPRHEVPKASYFSLTTGLGPATRVKITVFGHSGPGLRPGPVWPLTRIFGRAWILLLRTPGSARQPYRKDLGARLGPGMIVGLT